MKFVADVDAVIEAARHANKVRRRYERALDAACEYIWEVTKEAPEGATWKEYFLQGVGRMSKRYTFYLKTKEKRR